MGAGTTLGLYLPDSSNQYYEMVASDARNAARAAGLDLQVYFAENRAAIQARQIHDAVYADATARPAAIIVMSVRDDSLNRLAEEAGRRGIGWIFISRRTSYLEALRDQFPTVPMSFVSPDQHGIGRIQGKQCRALLPNGGSVLYVKGNAETSSARERLAGMMEAIARTKIDAEVLDGNWTATDTQRTVGGWLRMVMSGSSTLDLIACQSDEMAMGACRALESVAVALRRPELARIPVTGCDGLAEVGQRLVNENRLIATVVVPSPGGPAVNLIVRSLRDGELPPQEVLLSTTSYPNEEILAEKARSR